MTIRWKLNLALLAMLGSSMLAGGIVLYSVHTSTLQTLSIAQMRELSVLTDDVRAEVFYRLALMGRSDMTLDPGHQVWPDDLIDDIDVRIRLATTDAERRGWRDVRENVVAQANADRADAPRWAAAADRELRTLRGTYHSRIADATAQAASKSFRAEIIGALAALLSALVFGVVVLLIRDWLVKPVRILNEAADEIGSGNLSHRVPLTGNDELADLARRINSMAERLAQHQADLLESRELAAIGELCANVAHGLRNPLAGMRTSAQLGVRRLENPQQLRSALDDVIAEVDRLDRRITGLFEYAHVGKLRRQETRFADLAEDALSEARPVIQAKGITLRTTDETNGADWLLDRQQMAEAIGELIANAAHHSNDQGIITLSGSVVQTNGQPKQLCVTVCDQGRGMSPECVKRVFDLFYTTRPEGSGMGLPLVRRIVERHRGSIHLQSAVGEGTRVTLTLPGQHPAGRPGSA